MPKGVYSRAHLSPVAFSRAVAPVEDRFGERYTIEPNSGCWLWLGTATSEGRGIIVEDGKRVYATHISLRIDGRPRPSAESMACHRCDVPACVNPDHLFWGTHDDNMADQQAKGRHWAIARATCKNGHEWIASNTAYNRDGSRRCRACVRANNSKKSKPNSGRDALNSASPALLVAS